MVKTPKLLFYDTGLASYLLDIRESRQLETHRARGALFESLLVSEWLKHRFNRALPGNAFFRRDNVGNEIDLLLDHGRSLQPVEMKSGVLESARARRFVRSFRLVRVCADRGDRFRFRLE